MRRARRGLLVSACAAACLSGAAKAQAPDVYSFGDSLSDTGNVLALTFGLEASPDEYFEGRFSNGFVWNDYLSAFIAGEFQRTNPGLIGPFAIGRTAGYNFAHGGAVSGSNGLNFDVILDGRVQGALLEAIPAFRTTDQAEHFRDARFFFGRTFRPSANDFATISAGGNDYFNLETDVGFVVGNIVQSMSAIRSRGVRNFVVLDLPAVGDIPARFDSPNRDLLNSLSAQHNQLLRTELTDFANATGSRVDIVPAGLLFDLIRADAATGGAVFGFTVVAPGEGTSGNCLEDGLVLAACPDNYLFYDGIHPTARAHGIVGNLALSSLLTSSSAASAGAARTVGLERASLSQNRIVAGRISAARAGLTGAGFMTEGVGFGAASFARGSGALISGGLSFTSAGDAGGPVAGKASFYRYVDGQAPEFFAVDPSNELDPRNLTFSLNLQGGEYVTAFGSDVFLSENLLVGGLFSMSRQDNDQLRLRSDDRADVFSVYGAYFDGPLSISFTSRAARVEQAFVRQTGFSFAPTVRGESVSRTASFRLDGDYAWRVGGATIGAHAKASVDRLVHDGFEETGGFGLIERRLDDETDVGAAGYLGLSAGLENAGGGRFLARARLEAGAVLASSSDVGFASVLDAPGLVEDVYGEDGIFFAGAARETLASHLGVGVELAAWRRFTMTADADAVVGDVTRAVARMNAVWRF